MSPEPDKVRESFMRIFLKEMAIRFAMAMVVMVLAVLGVFAGRPLGDPVWEAVGAVAGLVLGIVLFVVVVRRFDSRPVEHR